MFDHLRCKFPLPVPGANALEFQTKDTDGQNLDHYEIREDGTLWVKWFVDPDDVDHDEWEPCSFSGTLFFYSDWDAGKGWVTFRAVFIDGMIAQLETIRNEPPSGPLPDPVIAEVPPA